MTTLRRCPWRPGAVLLPLFPLLPFLLAAPPLRAQGCFDFGSTPVPGAATCGPLLPACPGAPGWPAFHLWTPPHREPAPHPGFAPGDAHELPRWIVTWRCTGFLVVPVVPVQVRTMGYVIDQPEFPCGTSG